MIHFHKNQDVVCINDMTSYKGDPFKFTQITAGKVYTIDWVGQFDEQLWNALYEGPLPAIGIRLKGIERHHPFGAYRFKPVIYTNIDIFLRILKNKTVEEVVS